MAPEEPRLYRPYALLALGTTLAVGTPLGLALLARLHLGAPALALPWLALHGHVQIFGFFATLIVGVSPHLLARFTGRPLTPAAGARWSAAVLGGALAVRVAGSALAVPGLLLAATVAELAVFVAFAGRVWRTLDPPPLAGLRRHLTVSSLWLVAALGVEAWAHARGLALGLPGPDLVALRAVSPMALLGGVLGWVGGVLLRAGPMFAPDWRVSRPLVAGLPWLVGAGAALAALGELTPILLGQLAPATGPALARLGEGVALGTVAAMLLSGGAFRRARRGLPLLSRPAAEARIVRLAAVCLVVAAAGSLGAAVASAAGRPQPLVADALRHLLTVGFVSAVVIAMLFRLVPVLELRPLPWPGLRSLALWALGGAVALRTAQVLVPGGGRALGLAVVVSGVLAWTAIASVAANLVRAVARQSTGRPGSG